MIKIVIVGNAISADLIYEYLQHDDRYQIEAFSVDAPYIKEKVLFGRPVVDLANLAEQYPPCDYAVLIAVGYGNLNRNREQIFARVKAMGYAIVTYIHPDAKVYSPQIGEGSIIMPNAFIDVHAKIGENSVIWGNCSVAHNAKVGSNCWLATGCVISAEAELGANSFVGVSATVVNNVRVGSHNIIGAGSLVVKHTKDFKVYISRQTEEFRLGAEDYLRFSKL
jgi:sugar O-acyltransferase (sialic acid O-acetyltransferase NeuD family)